MQKLARVDLDTKTGGEFSRKSALTRWVKFVPKKTEHAEARVDRVDHIAGDYDHFKVWLNGQHGL